MLLFVFMMLAGCCYWWSPKELRTGQICLITQGHFDMSTCFLKLSQHNLIVRDVAEKEDNYLGITVFFLSSKKKMNKLHRNIIIF